MSTWNSQIIKHFSLGLIALALLTNSLLAFAVANFSLIHDFIGIDGSQPNGFLVEGQDGWLYGTTNRGAGSAVGGGVAFKIAPDGGSPQYEIIHHFEQGINAGKFPVGGLSLGSDGNFYGVTTANAVLPDGSTGLGAIFKMTTTGVVSTLHTFTFVTTTDPRTALSAPIEGPDGNLYGTTREGGDFNAGIVYKLNPSSPPPENFDILHHFKDDHIDGIQPRTSLIFGVDGKLYGTTPLGGNADSGTLFRISPNGSDYSILVNFGAGKGIRPHGRLLLGLDGNFYGTTSDGGLLATDRGTIFKLTPQGVLQTLKVFHPADAETDGWLLSSGLVQSSDGNFYGTTNRGGTNDRGVVFQLTPQGSYSVQHHINSTTDGRIDTNDNSNLTFHTNGMLYGAASDGGPTGTGNQSSGTLYRLDVSTSASTNPVSVPMLPPLAFWVLFGILGLIGIIVSKSKTHN